MTFDLYTAKRDEIATDLRNRDPQGLADYIKANGFSRQSEMSKADWIDAHECVLGGKPSTPAPAPTPAPTPAPAPASVDIDATLDGLSLVLSDKALTPLKAGIASLRRERDTARDMATRAKADAAAAMAATPAPVIQMSPAKPGQHVTKSVQRVNAGTLFPGSRTLTARNIILDVCDCPDAPRLDPNFLWDKQTPEMLTALNLGFNVLVYGPKGTGKSSWARNVAALLKRPYFQIGFHAETSSAELFGFQGPDTDGGVSWVPGDLLDAMQTPFAVIDLSEISFARPELTAQLFSVLESNDRTVFVGGTRYNVHPTVWFVGTSNDNGTGEQSHRYHGTRPMNPALVSRFVRVEFSSPERARLAKLIAKQAGIPLAAADVLAGFEKDMEKGVKAGNCEDTPGIRSALQWAALVKAGVPSRTAFDMSVLNSAPTEDAAYWAQEAAARDPHASLEHHILHGSGPVDDDDDTGAPDMDAPTRSGFTEI